jgi:23S rRNA (adenine2503-C2)-methyltransferase
VNHQRDARPDLKGMTLEELERFAQHLGEPAYRGRQIAHWLYQRGVASFAEMTDQPQGLRKQLEDAARITTLAPVTSVQADGGDTIKYLFRLADGPTLETVFMRYEDGRRSVCISTQVGCGMGCTFCATGLAGLTRNLTPAEIVDQAISVQRLTGERISNVVFMGMGEPLANYGPTMRAVLLLNARYALGIGMRHLTISTVGVVPQIRRLAQERLQLTLAVSLHAPTDELRNELVPINRQWPIADLLAACREYVAETNRRISFEYVLMEGVNDTPALAATLGDLLADPPGLWHVNLIPWNPGYGIQYRRPAVARVDAFAQRVRERGISTTVRLERGVEIDAACGQLRRTHGLELEEMRKRANA